MYAVRIFYSYFRSTYCSLELRRKPYTSGGLFKMSAMESFKKLHFPWNLGKRYNVIRGKENSYYNTPNSKVDVTIDNEMEVPLPRRLRRNTSLTRSVRDVVGTLRQVCFCFSVISFCMLWILYDARRSFKCLSKLWNWVNLADPADIGACY